MIEMTRIGKKSCTPLPLLKIVVLSFLLCNSYSAVSQTIEPVVDDTIYLQQGWDHHTRQTLYSTSFGSRFIPYNWFLALEQPDSTAAFRDNKHMAAMGFITTVADRYNPDGLPVGLVRDSDKKNGDYIGLTCAACHTGQVIINGKRIRIDGGQALINYTEFEQGALAALQATLTSHEKFSR